jgi:DNA invertase Pin-like site-specific DNA recombinase
LRKAGVHLATVTEGVTDWNNPTGRIVGNVNQEGKHAQLLDLSANVTRGLAEAANNGSWIGSIPYAYRLEGPKKNKRLVVEDPAKVCVVQRIFAEFVKEGRSMMNIANRLNAGGFLSPGGTVNGWRWDTV